MLFICCSMRPQDVVILMEVNGLLVSNDCLQKGRVGENNFSRYIYTLHFSLSMDLM